MVWCVCVESVCFILVMSVIPVKRSTGISQDIIVSTVCRK